MKNTKLPVIYRRSIPALFTLVSAAGMLPTTIANAQSAEEFRVEEQFFLNDDAGGGVKTGITNDGKTRFEIALVTPLLREISSLAPSTMMENPPLSAVAWADLADSTDGLTALSIIKSHPNLALRMPRKWIRP